MSVQNINIGLFGFGCVGQGLYDVLSKSISFRADIKTICIKHPEKKRTLDPALFTTDKWKILDDESINTVVELIDDADEAYHIVTTALRRGKNVVTANKKLLAEHLEELVALQKEYNVSLLYEAACCGGIPIIRTLEEYYDNELLNGFSGIFNGSSNYILTQIFRKGANYEEALKQAQELGFAETDPALDVNGFDPKFKLVILALHAFGAILEPGSVFNYGIAQIHESETALFKQKNIQVKLVPVAKKTSEHTFTAYVIPRLIHADHKLFHVNQEYNAVTVSASFSDEQTFTGKGAGGHPTGSAVLSDISALRYAYRYEYRKKFFANPPVFDQDYVLPLYISGPADFLKKFFPGEEIFLAGNTGILLTSRNLEWLNTYRDDLAGAGFFIAELGPETIGPVKEWIAEIHIPEEELVALT